MMLAHGIEGAQGNLGGVGAEELYPTDCVLRLNRFHDEDQGWDIVRRVSGLLRVSIVLVGDTHEVEPSHTH